MSHYSEGVKVMLQVDGWKEWADELASETGYSYEEISRCVDALGYEIGESATQEITPKILRLMSGIGTELKPSSLIKGFFTLRKLATAAVGLTAAVVDEIQRRPDLSERYSEESMVCQPGTRHTGSECVIENPDEGTVFGGSDVQKLLKTERDRKSEEIQKELLATVGGLTYQLPENERDSRVSETRKELLKKMKFQVEEEGAPERTYMKTEILEEAAKRCVEQGIEPDAIRAALSRGRPGTPYTKAALESPVYCATCGEPKQYHEKYGYICCAPHCSSNTIPAPKTEEPDIKLGEWVCRDCEGPLRKAGGVGIYECPCGHAGTIHAVGKRRVE